jgi:hypothetical protein
MHPVLPRRTVPDIRRLRSHHGEARVPSRSPQRRCRPSRRREKECSRTDCRFLDTGGRRARAREDAVSTSARPPDPAHGGSPTRDRSAGPGARRRSRGDVRISGPERAAQPSSGHPIGTGRRMPRRRRRDVRFPRPLTRGSTSMRASGKRRSWRAGDRNRDVRFSRPRTRGPQAPRASSKRRSRMLRRTRARCPGTRARYRSSGRPGGCPGSAVSDGPVSDAPIAASDHRAMTWSPVGTGS